MDSSPGEITALLKRVSAGDKKASDVLITVVYQELRRMARRFMGREQDGHTLQPTALVHEVYLKLVNQNDVDWQNRGHFFAIASQQMRRILVDHARGKNADRRGGQAVQVSLDEARVASAPPNLDVLLLDQALGELESMEPRAAKVVELRYFGGYTDKEVVEALGVSLATVRRDWEFARCWLFDRLKGPGKPGAATGG